MNKLKKCYLKRPEYVIPKITCKFCGKTIKQGERVYTIAIKWGDGKRSCEKCYDKFEER